MTEPAVYGLPAPAGDSLPAGGATSGASVLDGLRAELSDAIEAQTVTLPVPARPGYEVRFVAHLAYEDLGAYRKRAEDRSMPGGINEAKLAAILTANLCCGIIRNGEDLVLEGKPVTFSDQVFIESVGCDRAVDAVRKFYGRDGDLTRTAKTLLREAGYGEDASDPTRG